MFFNTNRKSSPRANRLGRRALLFILIAGTGLNIWQRADFSGISAPHAVLFAVFCAAWIAGAHISAKRRWMRFRLISLIYWGAAALSYAASALLELLGAPAASSIAGIPFRIAAQLPLRAVDDTLRISGAAAGLILFIAVMAVFYITLWRNTKLPL